MEDERERAVIAVLNTRGRIRETRQCLLENFLIKILRAESSEKRTLSLFNLLQLVGTNWGLMCLVWQCHPLCQHAQEQRPSPVCSDWIRTLMNWYHLCLQNQSKQAVMDKTKVLSRLCQWSVQVWTLLP